MSPRCSWDVVLAASFGTRRTRLRAGGSFPAWASSSATTGALWSRFARRRSTRVGRSGAPRVPTTRGRTTRTRTTPASSPTAKEGSVRCSTPSPRRTCWGRARLGGAGWTHRSGAATRWERRSGRAAAAVTGRLRFPGARDRWTTCGTPRMAATGRTDGGTATTGGSSSGGTRRSWWLTGIG